MKSLKNHINEASVSFNRMSKKVIGNELYTVAKDMQSLYDSVSKGNDVNMNLVNSIDKKWQIIKKSIKEFDVKDARTLPNEYKA